MCGVCACVCGGACVNCVCVRGRATLDVLRGSFLGRCAKGDLWEDVWGDVLRGVCGRDVWASCLGRYVLGCLD